MTEDHLTKTEDYLGDGLYVKFDGFGFELRAPRADGDHWVYLEPQVYDCFIRFVERMKQEAAR